MIGFRADKGEKRDWEDYVHYKTSDTIVKGVNGLNLYQDFEDIEEQLTKEIDWEERRYCIAKDIMAAFLSNSNVAVHGDSAEEHASDAVLYADALIAELKKGGER